MKKKVIRVVLWSVFVLLLGCIIFLMIPLDGTTYNSKGVTLEIPRLSIMMDEDKDHTFSARNIRSTFALEKDMDKIVAKLEKITCNNRDYYYNRGEDFTITEYGVIKRFVLNEVWFDYVSGNYCELDNDEES